MSPAILPIPCSSSSVDGEKRPINSSPSRGGAFGAALLREEAEVELEGLVKRIKAAKRVVVICGKLQSFSAGSASSCTDGETDVIDNIEADSTGAGISTAANIPDFRSASGIYAPSSSSTPHPAKRARTSDSSPSASRKKEPTVKDLFHINALSSDVLRPAQNALLSDLYERASLAEPTAFHRYLVQLEDQGRLLRCYTQNVDGLEGKAGLSVGIPEKENRTRKRRKVSHVAAGLPATPDTTPRKRAYTVCQSTPSEADTSMEQEKGKEPVDPRGEVAIPVTAAKSTAHVSTMWTPSSTQASSAPSPTPAQIDTEFPVRPMLPRVVPLHGLLASMRCTLCQHSGPLTEHLPLPDTLLACPFCSTAAGLREALFERSRPSGFLRPDIVLYGEEHCQGHLIGAIVEKDLKGLARAPRPPHVETGYQVTRGEKKEGKADMLIVAGTSLSIPGVKRMVKEFAKSIRSSGSARGKGKGKVVFVNQEAPARGAEWEDVFDYWVKGDVQAFVTDYLQGDVREGAGLSNTLATPPKTPRRRSAAPAKRKNGDTTPSKRPMLATPPDSTPALSMSSYASPGSPSSSDIDTPSAGYLPQVPDVELDNDWSASQTPTKTLQREYSPLFIRPIQKHSVTEGAVRPRKEAECRKAVLASVDDVFGYPTGTHGPGRSASITWGYDSDSSLSPPPEEQV